MNLYELRDAIAAVTEDQLLPFGACSYNDPENPGKSCIVGALMTADERAAIAPDYNKKGVRWLKLNGELPDRFIPIFEVLDRLQYRFDQSDRWSSLEDFKASAFEYIDIKIGADIETAN